MFDKFKPGDRVRETQHDKREGTVKSIEPEATHKNVIRDSSEVPCSRTDYPTAGTCPECHAPFHPEGPVIWVAFGEKKGNGTDREEPLRQGRLELVKKG